MKLKVYITPKEGILDPQGKAITSSLHNMGYNAVVDARQGKMIQLTLNTNDRIKAETMAKEICEKLLANTVVEDYTFDLIEI
jgi:phosphoribosylformylglycinamidine synthase